MSEHFKLSSIYGQDNECLLPGRLQVLDQIRIPDISSRLDGVRLQMRHFVDSIKTGEPEKPEAKDKSAKKHKKKKRHRENPEETAEKPEAQMEVDDLDRFISAVV